MPQTVFGEPGPGDRMVRRLAQSIDREIKNFHAHIEKARNTTDLSLIRYVNNTRLGIEQTANQLRTTDVPRALEHRAQNALTAATNLLSSYDALEEPIPQPITGNRNPPAPNSAVTNLSGFERIWIKRI